MHAAPKREFPPPGRSALPEKPRNPDRPPEATLTEGEWTSAKLDLTRAGQRVLERSETLG